MDPGGANIGLGDGSVRFIKNSVANRTWYQLLVSIDGSVISSRPLLTVRQAQRTSKSAKGAPRPCRRRGLLDPATASSGHLKEHSRAAPDKFSPDSSPILRTVDEKKAHFLIDLDNPTMEAGG
jgi:prepilin-type processing-associated H-X9-DG protein